MPGLPKFTRLMTINVVIPEAEVGPVNVGRYVAAPADLSDGERAPLLVDVKGRLYTVIYSSADLTVVQPVAADLKATVTQAAKDRTITSGSVDVGQYDASPEDLSDGSRGPLLLDVKGRPVVVQLEKDRTVETAAGKYVQSLAESADKKIAEDHVAAAGTVVSITPALGQKVVLLVVSGSAQTAGDSFKLQTLQSAVWTDVIEEIYVLKNGHFYFTFPCWAPDQDVGDGATATVRLTCAGTGEWTGFILYYLA